MLCLGCFGDGSLLLLKDPLCFSPCMLHNCRRCLAFCHQAGAAQVYKQQQAAVATEGSKETRFFEGAPAGTCCFQLPLCVA